MTRPIPRSVPTVALLGITALGMLVTVAATVPANAKILDPRPKFPTQSCQRKISANAVFNNFDTALKQSRINWERKAAAIYGRDFASWNVAKYKIVARKRDKIEQSWSVTHTAQPCGRGAVIRN